MKVAVALVLFALLPAAARADWNDLKAGMGRDAAWRCAGAPLLQNEGRGGNALWTYDRCGYIIFERGVVTYWEESKAEKTAEPAKAGKTAERPRASDSSAARNRSGDSPTKS